MLRTLVIAGALLLAGGASSASEIGVASHYGMETCKGKKKCETANGERFPTSTATAAHKTLPFGTIVRLWTLDGKHHCDLRINDRGPFIAGRIIDLSPVATSLCGFAGNPKVRLDVIRKGK